MIKISAFVSAWRQSPFAAAEMAPWDATGDAVEMIGAAMNALGDAFERSGDVAVHRTATIETGAIVKGPAIIGENCLVAASAYLRGGVFLDAGCIVGPACELKTTYMFAGSKLAHLSFAGDSIIGARANIEAGTVIANYRNEMADKSIRFVWRGQVVETGVEKFGALIGDDAKIGANSVIAPGAVLEPGFRLTRLGKIDQHPDPLR